MKKILCVMLSVIIVISLIGCTGGTPKGMSDEMYKYVKECTTTVRDFLDGKIERSETKELTEVADEIAELIEKENAEGLLDEKYYNDKEVATLTLTMLLYLYSEDSINELEDTLEDVEELIENK